MQPTQLKNHPSRLGLVSLLLSAFLLFGLGVLQAGDKDEAKGKDEGKKAKVELKDVPKAVLDTVNKALPDIKITEAEKRTDKDGAVTYELEGKVGDKKYEIKAKADGTLLKAKLETKDDEGDKEDGDEDDDDNGGHEDKD